MGMTTGLFWQRFRGKETNLCYICSAMPHLLFIHGTGVRGDGYLRTLDLIVRKASQFLPGVTVSGCAWGDPLGARLNKKGASIPNYSETGNAFPALESADQARWRLLAEDPLLELRILPEDERVGPPPGPWLFAQIPALATNAVILDLISPWELSQPWPACISRLAADPAWQNVVSSVTESKAAASEKVARAVVAAFQLYLRANGFPGLGGPQRDRLKIALLPFLGGPPAGVKDWFLGRLTNVAEKRRGLISDATSPAVGDILRYQARGGAIRNLIGTEVERTSTTILLAHSLGGVAAVDWLASEQRPIEYLFTVGSQAPYFYEIDALYSRAFGAGLPEYFPKWINFFDPNDFLSYKGQEIFPSVVEDHEVDNGQPFPESHSAYFHNDDQVWSVLEDTLAGA
jgi:hypothetical protein